MMSRLLRNVSQTKQSQRKSSAGWSHWSVINSTRFPVFICTGWWSSRFLCTISGLWTRLLFNIGATSSAEIRVPWCQWQDCPKEGIISNRKVMEKERSGVARPHSEFVTESGLRPQNPKSHSVSVSTGTPLGMRSLVHREWEHPGHLVPTALQRMMTFIQQWAM